MEAENLSIGLAFLAGLVSFISPCVLPLVPAYVGYMGGRATTEAGKEERNQFGTFTHGVFFVLGFTFFFVSFGLFTSAATSFLDSIGIDIQTLLTRLGGAAVIFFGLYVMKALDPIFRYLLRVSQEWKVDKDTITPLIFTLFVGGLMFGYFYWSFGTGRTTSFIWAAILLLGILALFRKPLNEAESVADFWNRAVMRLQIALISDTRQQVNLSNRQNQGYFGSFGLGIVFSAGWTPCIGPVFGAVLALAADATADSGNLLPAASMLTAYSMGLGIPFLLTALALNQSTSLMARLKRRMVMIERFSGALLLVIGVLLLTGGLTTLSERFGNTGTLGEISVQLEECTAGAFNGRIDVGSFPGCVRHGMPKLEDRYIQIVAHEAFVDPPFVFEKVNLDDYEIGLDVGERAPDFTVETLDGEEIRLSDFRGEAVLVNFWATWCGPCRAEMPFINNVYEDQKDRGFNVVAIDLMEDEEQITRFIEDELGGLSFTIGLDPDGDINSQYRIVAYPTSFLIDGNGIIVLKHSGGFTESFLRDELESKFESDDDITAANIE